jgi:hypothetical protein
MKLMIFVLIVFSLLSTNVICLKKGLKTEAIIFKYQKTDNWYSKKLEIMKSFSNSIIDYLFNNNSKTNNYEANEQKNERQSIKSNSIKKPFKWG